jgi:hypothetical protein
MVKHLRENLLNAAPVTVEDGVVRLFEGEAALGTVAFQMRRQRTVKERTHFFHRIFGYALRASPVGGIAHDPFFFVKLEPV